MRVRWWAILVILCVAGVMALRMELYTPATESDRPLPNPSVSTDVPDQPASGREPSSPVRSREARPIDTFHVRSAESKLLRGLSASFATSLGTPDSVDTPVDVRRSKDGRTGTVSVTSWPDNRHILLVDVGHAPRLVRRDEVRGAPEEPWIDLEPLRAATLVGRIIDEAGAPLAGAAIVVRSESGSSATGQARVMSAADGTFRVDNAPVDDVIRLTVTRDDHVFLAVDEAPIDSGTLRRMEDIVLPSGRAVRLRLVDMNSDQGIPDGWVMSTEALAPSATAGTVVGAFAAKSKPNGVVDLRLPSWPVEYRVNAVGYRSVRGVLAPSETTREIRLHPRRIVRLTFRASGSEPLDCDSNFVADLERGHLSAASGSFGHPGSMIRIFVDDVSVAEPRAESASIGLGKWAPYPVTMMTMFDREPPFRVFATLGDQLLGRAVYEGGDSVEIEIEGTSFCRRAALSLRLNDAAGRPWRALTGIRLTPSHAIGRSAIFGGFLHAEPDPQGWLLRRNLVPGEYEVRVSVTTQHGEMSILADRVRLVPDELTHLGDLVVPEPGSIVIGATAAARSDRPFTARVFSHALDAYLIGSMGDASRKGWTDHPLFWRALAPGLYRVEVRSAVHQVVRREVEVVAGRTSEVGVILEEGVPVTVAAAARSPEEELTVRVSRTATDEEVDVVVLPPGEGLRRIDVAVPPEELRFSLSRRGNPDSELVARPVAGETLEFP